MNTKLILTIISLAFFSFCFQKKETKPNIVFFLVDDLGWADLTCYGNRYHETPNIDKLAAESAKFTNAYAACAVCSPTRASIMTGKYPARLKITDWIPGVIYPNAPVKTPPLRYELPLEEEILPEILKKNNYLTYHVGKWHLGEEEKYYPLNQGFDVNIGGHSKGAPGSYFYPYKKVTPETDWSVKNMPEGGKEGDYLPMF
jgi:arylsulfatase A